MRLTQLGHACLLVQSGGAAVLIDPGVFSHGFEELTGLDAVLVTHQHVDHVDVERLPALMDANDGARLLAEPEIAAELRRAGIPADALHAGDSVVLGALTVTGVGGQHALIHPDIPRIGNVGMLLTAEGEPTLLHPGDSYAATPDGIDVLAFPLNAPWAAIRETADFVRAVGAARIVPVHDGLLSTVGRELYLRVLGGTLPSGTTVLDLAGAGPCTI